MRISRALARSLAVIGWTCSLIFPLATTLEQDAERIGVEFHGGVARAEVPRENDGGFLLPSREVATSSVPTQRGTSEAQEEDLEDVPGSGESSSESNDYSGEENDEPEEQENSGDEASIEEDDVSLSALRDTNGTQAENDIPHDAQESKTSVVLASPKDLKASATGYGGGYGGGYAINYKTVMKK